MPNSKKRSDLSAYKRPSEAPSLPAVLAEVKKEQPARPVERTPKKRAAVGRPKKPPQNKRDQKITLSLTKKEKQVISEKAGLIPEATYLLSKLRKAGLFD